MSFKDRLHKKNIVAKKGFNRWFVPPASIAIHLCIGSVYAWSMFNPALIKVLGVVSSSGDDWTLSQVVWIFSVAIVSLGLAAAYAGKWLEEVGPRMVGFFAACCWGGGFLIGAFGIYLQELGVHINISLPFISSEEIRLQIGLYLLYLGYGVLGGIGLGLGYVSPVSTLIRWFPDRRGMATGMAIMGFGGGAMIAKFTIDKLLETFYKAPEFLGASDSINLITEGGRRFAEISGSLVEVVVVATNEVSRMIIPEDPGVYIVGTGSSGAAETFLFLGIIYFLIMTIAAFSYRVPPEGWVPKGWTPPKDSSKTRLITKNHVHIDQALKTPQFYFLWIVLCFNVTAGIGVIGVAKTMMIEIFGSTLPAIVTASFAGTYVLMISVFNMIGRIFWASMSDFIGRKATYFIFFSLGILLYLSIPYSAKAMSINPSITYLIMFYAASMIIFTMYGGGFATIPAYLADIFGTKYVGGIHGRLLTAWSTAGVLGPLAITQLRQGSVEKSINELVSKVDPDQFNDFYGAPIEQIQQLVQQKTVTIGNLMQIVPEGTVDPSATLYNTTMFAMAGLLGIAFIANLLIGPVAKKHYMTKRQLEES
ncbi:MAG: MFS transporter [Rickettsiales bacterium]|nr:MFS transporter [Rickettsiales bacterium]